jgi:serine/threonine protein kinase
MELVSGETLADRIQRGAIPIGEALAIAKQIAEALEAAHEKGVIHRDLKPANIKAALDAPVKVLDFGLATAVQETERVGLDPSNSPTLTIEPTESGVILGTAAYMSPEQASGRRVDRRTDIWSFGVVVFEMLTGRRLFDGETVSHTLADVLRAEIDFTKLPASTPAPIRELLSRCLDREPKTRLRDIGEARITIQKYLTNPASAEDQRSAARPTGLAIAAFGLAAVLLIALSITVWGGWRAARPLEPRPLVRLDVDLGPDVSLPSQGGPDVILSPDGHRIVYRSNEGISWTRSDGANTAQTLIPSKDLPTPWSFAPDGKRLAFIQLAGNGYDIWIVPVEIDGAGVRAGKPEPYLQTPADERQPSFSPDGRWLVYASDETGTFQIYVRSFPDRGGQLQISNNGGAYPLWSRNGRELFFRNVENRIMVVTYTAKGDSFIPDKPRLWSDVQLADFGPIGIASYDLAPDGKRIAAVMPAEARKVETSQNHVIFLLNFFDEVRRHTRAETK